MYQQILSHFPACPAKVLIQLQSFKGLIFLHDDGKPVIGFLPQKYQIHNQFFIRDHSFNYQPAALEEITLSQHLSSEQIGFSGGWMGFIGYDYTASQFANVSMHTQPQMYLGLYLSYLKFENNQWVFYSTEANSQQMAEMLFNIKPESIHFKIQKKCKAIWSKQQYTSAFKTVQDYILAGDCYQINLTQQFKGIATGQLLATSQQLWQLTQAPYSGYLKIDDFELLSCSPELFINFKEHRKIVTRPIKGTMPRFVDPILDNQSKHKLIQSEKDQAENVMIVDLLRNDLSVYAKTGSVKTNKLFEIESFNQVHHMVSEIEAILKPDVSAFKMLLNALPGGSITGAPKIRAIEIISELEKQPRGAYCGSLGYFNLDGTGCWNILIRSIQKYQNEISVWAGGGITISSDCDAEYQECFDKIDAIIKLLNTFSQETS